MTNRSYDSPRLDRLIVRTGTTPGFRDPYGHVTTTPGIAQTVWASYRPFSGRDQRVLADAGLLTFEDARFVVRAETGPWTTGDAINFDGSRWAVKGVSELLGRGRYLEIVARRAGS